MDHKYERLAASKVDYGFLWSKPQQTKRLTLAEMCELVERAKVPLPKTLNELPQMRTYEKHLTHDQAIHYGVSGASIAGKTKYSYLIQLFVQYVNLPISGHLIPVGVGLCWTARLTEIKLKVNVSTMAAVAAAAELGLTDASWEFDTIGLVSDKIRQLLPTNPKLSVNCYVELANALANIKATIGKQDVTITPQILTIVPD